MGNHFLYKSSRPIIQIFHSCPPCQLIELHSSECVVSIKCTLDNPNSGFQRIIVGSNSAKASCAEIEDDNSRS